MHRGYLQGLRLHVLGVGFTVYLDLTKIRNAIRYAPKNWINVRDPLYFLGTALTCNGALYTFLGYGIPYVCVNPKP